MSGQTRQFIQQCCGCRLSVSTGHPHKFQQSGRISIIIRCNHPQCKRRISHHNISNIFIQMNRQLFANNHPCPHRHCFFYKSMAISMDTTLSNKQISFLYLTRIKMYPFHIDFNVSVHFFRVYPGQ